MQEQGKHKSLGPKPIVQEQKKQKVLGSAFMEEQGKGKGARVIFASDAERNLDGVRYRLGDMVWAKVKSHPWWPGQLYDPDLASSSAMEHRRDSCFLVAFFGDSTFGWFEEDELIPFESNFAQKSKQTSARNFVDAVEDALDEIRRRGMLGLTCRCDKLKSAPESREKKPGLLYDRQLREIRSTFKPAKLVALVKQLACSPLSSSQNMLGSTVLQAQAEAFCLRASRQRVLELKETGVLGGHLQSNQFKAHGPKDTKISTDEVVADKAGIKKRQLMVSQGQEDMIRADSLKEKLGGLNRVDKVKQHSASSSPKSGSTKKSEGFHGGKGGIKGTSSKSRGLKPTEDDAQDSRTVSVSVSHETLASAVQSLNTLKERDLVESGQNSGQPESCKASAVFGDGIQNAPSLEARDSLATNQKKAPLTKSKKNVGLTMNAMTVVVSEVDATELQVLPKKPSVVVKKAKVVNVEVGKVLTAKGVKKANVEVDKLAKKVKVVNVEVDQVLKEKRMAEDEPTEVLDASSRKTKKRKLLADTVGKGDSDHSLKEDTGGSLASNSTSDLALQRHIEEVMEDPTGPESQPNVEALMSMETRENSSSETPELVSEVGRLQQEETLQDEPEGNDAAAPLATGVQLLEQEDQLEAEHKAVSMVQAENNAVIGKNKKKELDLHTVELLKPDGLVFNDSEGNTHCSAIRDGEGNTESMETCYKVTKDQTSNDLNSSRIEADSRLIDSQGSDSLQSYVTCSAAEYLLDASQRMKEISVKDAQEERNLIKVVKERKQLKVAMSRKRVFEEKDHLLKDISARNKKMKAVSMGKDGAKRHEGLTKKTEGSVQPRDLHEGLMSVAAKPLDAANEEFYSAVHTAFMNFRKEVYCTGTEGSIASVEDTDAAAPEATNRTGFENCKPSELAREDAVVSTERGDSSFEAETLKVGDVRTEKDGTQEVLGGQKGPGEDSLTTPSKLVKKSVSFSKKISSSSISLRPATEAKIPVRGSKDVLNRFGQRVPRRSDDPERMANYPSRIKNGTEERALMITFPQGFLLPSELQLREVFAKFGDLNVPLTRIDSKSGCARIIFRHTQDAEAALSSMKENPVYENARVWLKPTDADVGELSKQSSKYSSSSERPVLSRSNKVEATNTLDKVESKNKRVPVLIESDIASDSCIQVENRSSMPHNPCLRKANDSGKEGAHAYLLSKCGAKNSQPSVSASAPKKAPIGEFFVINAGHESLDGTLSDHCTAAAPSSCPPSVGPMCLDPPVAKDISEPLLALLHQLHGFVGKIGFKF